MFGRWIGGVVTAVMVCSPVGAQNLLENSSFDDPPTVGWSDGLGIAEHELEIGVPAPSARLIHDAGEEGAQTVLYQCVPVAPDTTYQLGADVVFAVGEPATASAVILAYEYPNDYCGPDGEYGGRTEFVYGGHTTWRTVTGEFTTTSEARGVRISVRLLSPDGSGVTALYDNIRFGENVVSQTGYPCTHSYLVPAGARATGLGGSTWSTDLWVKALEPEPSRVRLSLLRRDSDNSDAAVAEVDLDAAASAAFPDVIGTLFGETSAAAALRVCSDGSPLMVTSRTANVSAKGTFGQGIPGYDTGATGYIGTAKFPNRYRTSGHLIGLTENTAFRTNVGFASVSPWPITVDVELFDDADDSIGVAQYVLPPYGHIQMTRIYDLVSPGITVDNGSIAVTAEAAIAAYASVVDNATGDPTYIAWGH